MKKKALITVASIALVLCVAAGATLAWLQDKTQEVKNTFTVGDVDIAMSETVNGVTKNTDTTGSDITNNSFKMIPGATLSKDPKVIVNSGSEACWLFVEIDESTNFGTFMEYDIAEGWNAVQAGSNVYYRVVDAATAAAGATYSVLKDNKVTVRDGVTKAQLDALTPATLPTLNFKAYAIQSANLINDAYVAVTTAAEAWAVVNAE